MNIHNIYCPTCASPIKTTCLTTLSWNTVSFSSIFPQKCSWGQPYVNLTQCTNASGNAMYTIEKLFFNHFQRMNYEQSISVGTKAKTCISFSIFVQIHRYLGDNMLVQ